MTPPKDTEQGTRSGRRPRARTWEESIRIPSERGDDRPVDWGRVLRALVPVARMALDELEGAPVTPEPMPDGLRDAVENLASMYGGSVSAIIREDANLPGLDHAIDRVTRFADGA